MKLAVVGSRSFNDYKLLSQQLHFILKHSKIEEVTIVSGGARGADSLAEQYANEHNLMIKVFKPDWETYPKTGGFIRNKQIEEYSDMCIAFWNGKSNGTKHTIKLFADAKKPTTIVMFKEPVISKNAFEEFLELK